MNSFGAMNTSLPSIKHSNIAMLGPYNEGSSTVRILGGDTERSSNNRSPQNLNLDDLINRNPGFAVSMRTSPRR